jgi:hypothetical protein
METNHTINALHKGSPAQPGTAADLTPPTHQKGQAHEIGTKRTDHRTPPPALRPQAQRANWRAQDGPTPHLHQLQLQKTYRGRRSGHAPQDRPRRAFAGEPGESVRPPGKVATNRLPSERNPHASAGCMCCWPSGHPLHGFDLRGASADGCGWRCTNPKNRPLNVWPKLFTDNARDAFDHRAVLSRNPVAQPLKHHVVRLHTNTSGQCCRASSDLDRALQSGELQVVHAPIIDSFTICARISIFTMASHGNA